MLQVILRGVAEGHTEVTAVYNQSLQLMNQRATSEIEIMADTVAAAVAATLALQNQIVRAA